MKRRRKFTTTKNNHNGGIKTTKVQDLKHLDQLELDVMENTKGQKIGLNLNIKIPQFDNPITFSGVYELNGFMKEVHEPYMKIALKESLNVDWTINQYIGGHLYSIIKRHIDNNGDDEGCSFGDKNLSIKMIERGMSYCLNDSHLKNESDGNYNKYFSVYMTILDVDDKSFKTTFKANVHSSYESFQNESRKMLPLDDLSVVHHSSILEQEQEDFDQVKIVDEPIDYTVDDIQIVDDAPIPMLGLNYEILSKLKESMSILQIGQTIKLPKDERLRSSVYLLNKQHFSEKRFSVYEVNNNYIVFLNTKKKEPNDL